MRLAKKINKDCPLLSPLVSDGYLVVKAKEKKKYAAKLETLGMVFRTTDVKIKTDEKMAVYNPSAIPFHTDSPEAEIISWTCLDPGDSPSTSMFLIDGIAEIERLSTKEQLEIARATIKYRPTETDISTVFPVISDQGFSYNRWHLDISQLHPETGRTLIELFSGSRAAIKRIQLCIGDTLVVDNLRMLHGRPSISPNSKRHLQRRWIKSDLKEELR